jgi:hypothetical protein
MRSMVEEGSIYLSQIDGKDVVVLGFRPEGLFEHRISRSSLFEGRHRLTVYRLRLGDKPSMTQVRSIAFDIQNGN